MIRDHKIAVLINDLMLDITATITDSIASAAPLIELESICDLKCGCR